MEVNFEGSSLRYFERVCSAVYTCEETMEVIVPDALPDVSEILTADGQSFLRGKEARRNTLAISGVSELTVLYCPEDGGLKQLRVELPFTGESACPELAESDQITACVHLMSAEARILNSRKLIVRAEVCILAGAWSPKTLRWAKELAEGTEAPIERKREEYSIFPVTEVTERTFEAGDTLPLPAGKPPVGELLFSRTALRQEEASPVGGRLILRGTALVSLVYLSLSGELAEAELRAPWSVVLELQESEGEQSYDFCTALTGVSTEVSDGGIRVELAGVAQVSVRRRTELCCITDAYGVDCELRPETETKRLTTACTRTELTDVLNLHLEGKQVIRSLTAIFADCGKPRLEKEVWRLPVTVKALCSGDGGNPMLLTGRGEAVCRGVESPGLQVGELYASVSSAGADVRVPVVFSGTQEESRELTLLTGAEMGEAAPEARQPSAILLRTAAGDTVWSLGKRKRLPCAAIRSVNGLGDEEEPAAGTLLLLAR